MGSEDALENLPLSGIKKEKKFCCFNGDLLPIKLHFVLAYGAVSGVIPFLPVLIKSLGINATALGIINTILPFTIFFAKPSLGAITDYLKNIRCVITTLITIAMSSYFVLLFIPEIQSHINGTIFDCGDDHATIKLPIIYNSSCIGQERNQIITCETGSNVCSYIHGISGASPTVTDLKCNWDHNKTYLNFAIGNKKDFSASHQTEQTPEFTANVLSNGTSSGSSIACSMLTNLSTSIQCSSSVDGCVLPLQEADEYSVYRTYQFWVILFALLLGGTCSTAMYTLSDAACYEILGDRHEDYGKQRLWATVGCGVVALGTGYLNDLKSAGSLKPDYTSGFFIMLVLAVMDVALLFSLMNLKITSFTPSILKDVGRLFATGDMIVFACSVFIIGALCGLLGTYEFWFLESLGGSHLLIGLTVFVQCVIAEMPFFFFSGWIIQKLGHSLCVILTFVAFAIRYFLYFMLDNPWYVLLIDVLHGWTYGVFYAAMTSYASQNAPYGTEATMQGVLGGLCEGFGYGIGSLLGGVGFDRIGGHSTFLWAAVLSAICSLIFSVPRIFLRS